MVAAAAVPVQHDLIAVDVLLKPDCALTPAGFTAGRHPKGDRRVGQRHADDITPCAAWRIPDQSGVGRSTESITSTPRGARCFVTFMVVTKVSEGRPARDCKRLAKTERANLYYEEEPMIGP